MNIHIQKISNKRRRIALDKWVNQADIIHAEQARLNVEL